MATTAHTLLGGPRRSVVAAATMLAPVSWGTTYVTVTELLPSGRPLLVAALRVLPAGLVLVVVGSSRHPWRPSIEEYKRLGLLSLCNFAMFFPLLTVAVYRLPGGVAAAVGGIQPLLVSVLGLLVLRRRPSIRELVVGVVAIIGVALIVIRPGATVDTIGLAAALGANVAFACGVLLTKRFPPPPDRITATGWQLLIAACVLMPLALTVEGAVPHLSARNVVGFAYLSIVGTGLAFAVWFSGIRRLPPTAPPLLGIAAPVTGATLGCLLLDERITPWQGIGFIIAVGAVAYGAVHRPDTEGHARRQTSPPTTPCPCGTTAS